MALTDGLIEYWKLDGNSNGVFGYNGSDTSVTYNSSNGKLIEGAGYGGSSYTEVAHNAVFNVTTALSISLWMKTSTSQTNKYLISKPSSVAGSNGWDINTGTGSGKIRAILAGLTPSSFEATALIYDGNWHHIVLAYGSNNVIVYIDNASSGINTNTTGSINTNSNPLTIGNFYRTTFIAGFNGAIDEISIWNKKLTVGEISDLYSYGIGSQYPFRDKGFLSM